MVNARSVGCLRGATHAVAVGDALLCYGQCWLIADVLWLSESASRMKGFCLPEDLASERGKSCMGT
jgi:hypothetical protein